MQWPAVGILMGFSLLCLMVFHTHLWWFYGVQNNWASNTNYLDSVFFPFMGTIGITSLFFPMISGASLRLALGDSRGSVVRFQSIVANLIFKNLIARGLFLIFLGFVLNFARWDALQLIGISIIITAILFRFNILQFASLIVVLILLGTFLFKKSHFANQDFLFKEIILGTDKWHLWPILPWLASFFIGFMLSDLKQKMANNLKAFNVGCAFIGITLTLCAILYAPYLLPKFDSQLPLNKDIFQPPILTFMGWVGIFLLYLLFFQFLNYLMPIRFNLLFNGFISSSLYIYVVHIIIGQSMTKYISKFSNPIAMWIWLGIQSIVCIWLGQRIYIKIQSLHKRGVWWL